ncbi:MAG: LysR family transcriptional regulator [Oleispira sp.]|nr:LysR family transcriptional regulator [Oleispira sp.]MBL4882333.1 LysR family transcriptional regulator [Oleispira sp.]
MKNRQRLPPIQYLVAFVTAAKLCSFKLAARELNITPSAISQQIKNLENHIGLALFSREKRELQLTGAGEAFYLIAKKTMSSYENGYAQFSDQFFSSSLRVSMIPFVAHEIVIPHLHEFQIKHPEINFIIETSAELKNLETGDLDGAVRFGLPPWGNTKAERICSLSSNLVASKEYLKTHSIEGKSENKAEINWQNQTLIHSRSNVNDWQRYMSDVGVQFKPKNELFFDSYEAGLRAAEEGLGIALAVFPMSANKIKTEKLVVLSDQYVPIKEGVYWVTKANENKQDNYQTVLGWLQGIF